VIVAERESREDNVHRTRTLTASPRPGGSYPQATCALTTAGRLHSGAWAAWPWTAVVA